MTGRINTALCPGDIMHDRENRKLKIEYVIKLGIVRVGIVNNGEWESYIDLNLPEAQEYSRFVKNEMYEETNEYFKDILTIPDEYRFTNCEKCIHIVKNENGSANCTKLNTLMTFARPSYCDKYEEKE